jgi:hypothetical protein
MQEEATKWAGEGWKEKFCFDSLSPCLSVCLSVWLRSTVVTWVLGARSRARPWLSENSGSLRNLLSGFLLRRSGKETREDFKVSGKLGAVYIALRQERFLGFLGMLGPVHITLRQRNFRVLGKLGLVHIGLWQPNLFRVSGMRSPIHIGLRKESFVGFLAWLTPFTLG